MTQMNEKNKVNITINGEKIAADCGETILQAARRHNIEIPTLCYDEGLNPYGACGLCVVAMEGSDRLFRACATQVAEGQVIYTDTEAVRKERRTALELLLSNHRGDCIAPCKAACPAGSDCQAYVGLIANNRFAEAAQVIKDSYPLGASLGRVCPHPCEAACRRAKVEHPLNLARLKQFAADVDLNSAEPYLPTPEPPTGKRVAIVGSGPAGLTMAYFLALKGHKAEIFEMMPEAGGMLRYGIPEYRLPKNILDLEIKQIQRLGVEIHYGQRLGGNLKFEDLRQYYDAIYLATGAWQSAGLNVPGEELQGVVGGIDFLGNVAMGNLTRLSGRVAVVGGGNTAMDACRTAVRLGAEEVYILYRRTEAEMPAEMTEIREAAEEGVQFKFLVAPTRIAGADGRVIGIELQQMELGEPDASGRRRPVPVEGGIEVLPVDTVIAAIGQKVLPLDLGADSDKLKYTEWRTIQAEEGTYATSIPGVFAGGDAINDGPGIAIQAVAHAKDCAKVIDGYLRSDKGELQPVVKPFYSMSGEPSEEEFAAKTRVNRVSISFLHPEFRKSSFTEVAKGYDPEEAIYEASRCLECGCGDVYECKLLAYARQYDVDPNKFAGEMTHRPKDNSHPYIMRDPDKCILCGNCVRACDEMCGENNLGLLGRGFDTAVSADFGLPLGSSACVSCGQCVAVCPTGALQEKQPWQKPVPLDTECNESVCTLCGNACRLNVHHKGDYVAKVTPNDGERLCQDGRFGYPYAMTSTGNPTAFIDYGEGLNPVASMSAVKAVAAAVNSLRESMGADVIGVAVGDNLSAEEIYLAHKLAINGIGTENIYAPNAEMSGLRLMCGADGSTATVDDLDEAELLLAVGDNLSENYPLVAARLLKAAKSGKRVLLLADKPGRLAEVAEVYPLDGKADLLLDICENNTDNLAAAEIFATLSGAKRAVLVYDATRLALPAQATLAAMAAKLAMPVLELLSGVGSRVIRDLGITRDFHRLKEDIEGGKLKAMLLFGVDLPALLAEQVDFVFEADANYGRAYPYAKALLPLSGFGAVSGTYVSFEGRVRQVNAAIQPYQGVENWQLFAELLNGVDRMPKAESLEVLRAEMAERLPSYSAALLHGAEFVDKAEELLTVDGVVLPPRGLDAFREFENENTAQKAWAKMRH